MIGGRMLRKISLLIVTLITMSTGVAALTPATVTHAAPLTTFANSKQDACKGLVLTGGTCAGSTNDLSAVIKQVINILSIIVGVAAVIMIIIGGFKYVTSGGDANNIASAKNTIIYAI